MTCILPGIPACETNSFEPRPMEIDGSATSRQSVPTPPIASNPLERLAQLLVANDRLMGELATSRARIVAARVYLDGPDCHTRFGSAHLERCRSKHSGILAQLRSNRIEALHLLGDQGSND